MPRPGVPRLAVTTSGKSRCTRRTGSTRSGGVSPAASAGRSGGADAAAWQQDQRLLIEQHTRLREAVAGLTVRDLARPIGSRSNAAFIVRGIAAHDLYHAGQVQLLKRLQR